MKRVSIMAIVAFVALVALGVYTCVVIFFPDDITKLAKRGVPLPQGQMTTIATESGGTFGQYIFAAIQLDESTLQDYTEALKGTCPQPDVISPTGNCVVITSAMSAETRNSYGYDPDRKFLIKKTVNGAYLDWWQIERIANGLHYEAQLPDACGYEVYLDMDRRIAYIYWHYS